LTPLSNFATLNAKPRAGCWPAASLVGNPRPRCTCSDENITDLTAPLFSATLLTLLKKCPSKAHAQVGAGGFSAREGRHDDGVTGYRCGPLDLRLIELNECLMSIVRVKKIKTKSRSSYLDEWMENCADWLLGGARTRTLAVLAIAMFIVALIALLLHRPNGTQIDAQSPITENVWTTAWDNQPPSRDELPSAHQQAEELRSQLSQAAAEQLKATQDRNSQLEAELSQRPSRDDLSSAQQQTDELRSQLSQAAEQLKATQDRNRQLEAEVSQRPSQDDLSSAQKQADELRSQLSQAAEQLATTEDRTRQLEAELNQRPSRDELNSAQRQSDQLRSQLGQAAEQLKGTQDRNSQLEAELNQRPSRGDLTLAQHQADELRSQLSQTTEQLKASQVRSGQQEAELQEHRRAAQLALLNRGDALFSSGDIASARLFYERAAEAGNADAALRLGETYDPAFLKRVQPREYGNSSRALFWYGRARELGATEADILLKDMQTR
jgi:hypothetical protein